MCYDLSILSFSHEGYELVAGYYPENGDYYELELLQFTGLKDKTGKAIFEGDIVKDAYGYLFEINYKEGYARFNFRRITGITNGEMTWHILLFGGEVIGNIYENPELLTAKERKE